jgi:hypothetical protein
MNASARFCRPLRALLALGLLLTSLPCALFAGDEQPVITGIRLEGTNLVIQVQVPGGLKKIMLQGRERLGKGAWIPRAVKRISDAAGGVVEFRLPQSSRLETLRVQADVTEALGSQVYEGTRAFAPSATSPSNPNGTSMVPTDGLGAGGAVRDPSSERSVVESDIWKRDGDTLYFFNQYRGLQIIDVSRPDSPQLRGQVPLPAAGDQMYVLSPTQVLLLARDNCSYSAAGSESEVLLVDVTDKGAPKVASRLPVPGYIAESRLVGTALYVASQTYRQKTNDAGIQWEWGTGVTSIDFSNPAAPARGDTLWFPGWGQVIQATDQYLFLAHTLPIGGWPMDVEIVDISDPRGAMKHQSRVSIAGTVPDKFKINQKGDVLTVISQSWSDTRRWLTVLETFSLAQPASPRPLGRLELAAGEQLHATRFDGNRVYVVTFLRVDPLWVVDLSDPVRPRIAGELEVPGWSTYIQPLGDRLVTIGIDPTNGWRVAVSLFDVREASKPALFDKVLLGENYSWSEATYDEKAFSVLPEAGLILVPYQGYLTNGFANRIQLIDLGATNLALRGQIQHALQPRRATVHRDRIYSISGTELMAVDATDRDHPAVKSTVALSWSVDQVFASGAYLLQITDGSSASMMWYRGWSSEAELPAIRVALAAQPNTVLRQWEPRKLWPIVGTAVRGDRLYVLQGQRPDSPWGLEPTGDTNQPPVKPENLLMTVIDLSQLPEIAVITQSGATVGDLQWGATFDPLWPAADLIVWAEKGGSYFWFDVLMTPVRGGVVGPGAPIAPVRGVTPPPFWYPYGGGAGTGRLLPFEPSTARWLPEVASVGGTNAWGYSLSYAAPGLVFTSHTTYDVVTNTIEGQPYQQWLARYWLDVVDFADPTTPTLRPSVSLPAELIGLAQAGDLLFTKGMNTWKTNDTSGQTWLAAVAYDGVEAHLADAMPMPVTWPQLALVKDGLVFLTRVSTNYTSADLEVWEVNSTLGTWAQVGLTPIGTGLYSMATVGAYLGISDGRSVNLIDVSVPAKPRLWLKGQFDGCVSGGIEHGDATSGLGAFLPLGSYGVGRIAP